MATGGTPSGRGFVFNAIEREGRGGGGGYVPNAYAAAYSEGKGIMDMLDWQDRKRREATEEQWLAGREQREQEKEAREQARLDLQTKRADLQYQREQAYEARKQAREDQYMSRMDDLDKIIGAINDIDPIHKNATGMLNDVRSSQEFHRLMANRDTRQALNDAWKAKTGEIKDVIGGIQHEAKSKYGIDADLSKFPVDENGNYDFQKGYNEHLPMLAQQMQQKAKETYEQAQAPKGMQKYAQYDEYGRPIAKFAKAAPVGQEERVQIASELGLVPSGISAGGRVTYSKPKEQPQQTLPLLPEQPSILEKAATAIGGLIKPKVTPTPLPSATPEATTEVTPTKHINQINFGM